MKKFLVTVIIILIFPHHLACQAYEEEVRRLFNDFNASYNSGDFLKAENSMLKCLDLSLRDFQECSTYSNLGSVYILMGRFDDALECFNQAEKTDLRSEVGRFQIAGVYINKGIIYRNRGSYILAREYIEKGIRIYNELGENDPSYNKYLGSAYYNLGVCYYNMEENNAALDCFNKSAEIRKKFGLSYDLELLITARTYARMRQNVQAESFFKQGIEKMKREWGNSYFRLAESYFGYGQFLQSTGRKEEALQVYRKALDICRRTYGEKNNVTSIAYKNIGEFYFNENRNDSALFYYQRSLISVVRNFNNTNVLSNPSVDSSILDIRLLDNLKGKAMVLEKMADKEANTERKLDYLSISLQTTELALDLIEIIKNNFPSEESRIYIAENEKETFISGIRIASAIHNVTGDEKMLESIYSIAQRAKASLLRNQITGNNLLYSSATPDSLRDRQKQLSLGIASYNKLLQDENGKAFPDSSRINFWKDELFRMNREREEANSVISGLIPQYNDLLKRTEPIPFREIIKRLDRDEIIIDYILSTRSSGGERKLYVFLISKKGLIFRETSLDSLFRSYALLLKNTSDPSLNNHKNGSRYLEYSSALHYMYKNLVKPVEQSIREKHLIIIPDEEIAWLPFEAFIKELKPAGSTDFEGSDFLINDYVFSYAYSASLLPERNSSLKNSPYLMSFSPSYSGNGSAFDQLEGAMTEINEISNIFNGRKYLKAEATKNNFINATQNPAIFHLAMHSVSDSVNSLYSYLLFNQDKGDENARLYNYEISLSRLVSPMIVLSSCNSGAGTLYSGEGLMSLARSFILAGASSVVRTAWEVNDDAGSEIITKFYRHLAGGKNKDEALKLAKTEFMKSSPPAFSDPYYWAAYEVLGDNGPVRRNNITFVTIVTISILAFIITYFYLRRRKILSDRSL